MLAHNHPRLQVLVGAAGLDDGVRYRLLNGQRRQVAAEFGLSGREIEIVMRIEATAYRDFVRHLHHWVTRQQPGAA